MPEVRPIDATELVRYMCGACPSHQNGECIDKMCWKYEDRARIENAPTIEAEPVRHGHWIWLEPYGALFTHRRKCSECGDIKAKEESNFCPNCGANMRRV